MITSFQNPKIKVALKLQSKRHRDRTQTFLIEGYRELSSAVSAHVPIQTLFYSKSHFLGVNEEALIQTIETSGACIYEVTPPLFDKLSYRDRGDGLLGIAVQKHLSLTNMHNLIKKKSSPFLLIAEAIEKPGNLGSILRSADAAGVDALILCDPCTDIYNPNVVRASIGTLFTVPIIEAPSKEALSFLQKEGIRLIASSPDASRLFTKVDLKGPIAIAVGTEQLGLSSTWLKAADFQVKIPMHGTCDSLNVAAATTLLLYEAVRQRS